MSTYINWSQIYSIEKLFVTTNTLSKESTIYGNGLNQTEIIAHMVALDERGDEIKGVPTLDLLNNSNLINYITGKTIHSQNGVNDAGRWSFSLSRNGFNFAPPTNDSESDNTNTETGNDPQTNESTISPLMGGVASYYIMCGPNAANRSEQFAIEVTLTHPQAPVQTYSTGLSGTPGFDSCITVKALDPIDYSKAENRVVHSTPSEIRNRSIKCQMRNDNSYTDYGDQICWRSTIVISPARGGTFHTVENLSDLEINDHYVNQGDMSWQNSDTPGFTGIRNEYPISILGRTLNEASSYFINYWYLNPQTAQFDGHCLLHHDKLFSRTYYRIFPNFNENLVHETPNPGRLVCWKFELKPFRLINILWRLVERNDLKLRLIDRYGNQGIISVTFDLKDWFDTPRIV